MSGSAKASDATRVPLSLSGEGTRSCSRQGLWRSALAFSFLLTVPALALPSAVSINLCTDQLLVTLADPAQILGLSPFARDRIRSPVAREAEALPLLSGTAEEVMMIRPDLVLSGRYTKRATRELLRGQGVRIVELDAVRSLDAARAQIRQVGDLLGHPDRAEAALVRLDAAIARARRAAVDRPASVLPLQRRGWVTGGGTLLTSLLDVVGLANAGARVSGGLGRFASLEEIVTLRPDLLLVSEAGLRAEDQGSALLTHPALARLYPPARRIVLPESLSVFCGGPGLADTIDRLAAEIGRPR